ncbi:MAG: hypothetical protein ACYDHZ_03205 [Dehalococcoidia bacterium]
MWDDYCNASTAGSGFLARFARGTKAAPANVIPGDRLGFNVFGGWAGNWIHTAAIEAIVDTGTVSGTSLPTYMRFSTTPDGSLGRVERMRIASGGNISVNSLTDPYAKVYVLNDNINPGCGAIIALTTAGSTAAVAGWHASPTTYGDLGDNVSGVFGASIRSDDTIAASGELGDSTVGVYGFADNATIWAGYFQGDVNVTGTLTSGVKDFRIDDPLDPENKYLVHSSVESPDMKNIYDGVAVLDNNGEAVVTLPAYFQALNRDFRYQLTCIGGYAPVYIASEISGNTFKIAGGPSGTSGLKISWQVTGIRQDAFAVAHPLVVEQDKPAAEKGQHLFQPSGARPSGLPTGSITANGLHNPVGATVLPH